MNELVERAKQALENLNERERKLVMLLGALLAAFVVGLPLLLMYGGNSDLEIENAEYRDLLTKLTEKGPQYAQLAEQREKSARLYNNKAPPLGSFLEAEARKQGLTVKEVNDQPEKSSGGFLRRSVSASFPSVELTPALQLMASIVQSQYPVAIEQIQLEHYQPGDQYNLKLGILTFDKVSKSTSNAKSSDVEGEQ